MKTELIKRFIATTLRALSNVPARIEVQDEMQKKKSYGATKLGLLKIMPVD